MARRNFLRRSGPRRAFTLVEILSVIGILAVLTAILLPVFFSVRAKSRQATCASNMRQIGMALLQYAQDHDEQTPNAVKSFSRIIIPLNQGWGGRIYPYLKKNEVYQCPDDPTTAALDSTGRQSYPVSYGLNMNLRNQPHLASLNAPASTVLLFEVVGDRAQIDQADEGEPGLGPYDTTSPVGEGSEGSLWATTKELITTSAGPVRYATGEMDNHKDSTGNDFYAGQRPRHHDGANYLAADGHLQFLNAKTVSAGYNASAPTGEQAPKGCYANRSNRTGAPCAEGTAVGKHRLTFSVN
jgi:prepilin-type N-terminal cleavage/methylation domain-containing protein/prepilin-type processing-associated H-X9-DG protein